MPTFEISGRRRERRPRPQVVLAVVVSAALAVGLLTLADDGAAEDQDLGPTVTAGARDLATTLEDSGTLERSSEHTVAYAGALVADGLATEPGGAGDSRDDDRTGADSGTGDDDGTTPVANFAATDDPSSTTSVAPTSSSSSSSSSSSAPSSSSTTTCPSTPGSSSTTSSPGSPCPSTTTSSSTTAPTTSTTRPTTTSSSPPGSTPGGGGGDGGRGDAPPGGGDDQLAAGDAPGGRGGTGDGGLVPSGTGSPSGTGDTGDTGDGTDQDVSATLTGVLDVGATAERGAVLYTADDQPVVALLGDLPAWRRLEAGIDDGADVRQLEENLAALGYGAGLDVDESFTSETAAAVEDWETDLARADPDGAVEVGDVVFLASAGDVLGHDAEVGDTLQPGSPVLTIGAEQRIVVAEVSAAEAGGWTAGSTVDLEWADGTTSPGTVFGTGRDVTDGQVDLVVAVGAEGASSADGAERRTGAEAAVTLEDARRDDVIAVPVAAIVEHDGGPAVRVARAGAADEVVAVETGLVAGGWVEITTGLEGGEEVRLPG